MKRTSILSLATALPDYKIDQQRIAPELAARLMLDESKAAQLTKIFAHSHIAHRYSVCSDFGHGTSSHTLFPPNLRDDVPGMSARNAIYIEKAPSLALDAAKKAIAQWGGKAEEITHIVTVSCTGVMAPGIEFLLLQELGCSPATQRYGINFMGCFGAFKGLGVADAFAQQDSNNRVLVVCVELCSLHFQPTPTAETFVANALFGDGAAAVVVGQGAGPWQMQRFASFATPNTLDEMSWEASDTGYLMRLTQEVPRKVKEGTPALVERLIAGECRQEECDWAIHPGGKAILHGLTQSLGISKNDLRASYDVLEQHGNMSSPTLLFVLDALRYRAEKPWQIGLGFGPGLSIEGVLLKWEGA